MIAQEELAAIAAALAALTADAAEPPVTVTPRSRWKLAARRPELEMEDIRALR